MSQIFVPSKGPQSWQELLADPDKHWKPGKSARTLAYSWEAQAGFPPEIDRQLKQESRFADIEPLFIFPEWKVDLPPAGGRPSQNDVWVLAKASGGLVSIAVEGKVDEPFDKTVGEWLVDASRGKDVRLAFLLDVLGLSASNLGMIRYQLLHRTASAVLEAERTGATAAVMLVHSFSKTNQWFDDFAAFAGLFGLQAEMGRLVQTQARNGMPLYLGWASGIARD